MSTVATIEQDAVVRFRSTQLHARRGAAASAEARSATDLLDRSTVEALRREAEHVLAQQIAALSAERVDATRLAYAS